MDKITKLPWEIKKEITGSGYCISSKDELKRDVKLASFLTKADAEYICRAVNSHEGLVEALKRSHACATVKDDGSCEGCFVSEALNAAQEEK